MTQTIKLRRSATSGNVPTTAQLDLGEVAINTYDGKMFFKKNDGSQSIQEVVTVAGGDSRYQLSSAPNAPASVTANIVGDTIEVVFSQSSTSDIDAYEVWSDGGASSYSLIGRITSDDFSATMTVVDSSFGTGTIGYRVFAVKGGVYSSAATTTKAFSAPSLDVSGMTVVADTNSYVISYELPESRYFDHVEIYMDAELLSSNLTRTGATLVYSGDNSSFTYQISSGDLDKFHQFWVEVVTS